MCSFIIAKLDIHLSYGERNILRNIHAVSQATEKIYKSPFEKKTRVAGALYNSLFTKAI